MKGLIGKKLGMTTYFDERGNSLPCTVIEAGPCVVTQVKTDETDGYNALQVGFDEKSEKNTPKPLIGHFKKANTEPLRKVVEFRDCVLQKALGEEINVEIFEVGEYVDVIGTSKGKGFQGVVKRYGFSGVGMATHGQHNRLRAPGSIGAGSDPSRVFKGMRMGGRTGNQRVKVIDLEILKVIPEKNLLYIRGAVPGHKGAYVIIES